MANKWQEVEAHPKLSELEAKVRKFWQNKKIFEKSIEERPVDDAFTFYDGPPFATGLPHYGHLLQGYMKDAITRYWTMRGKRIERRFGWDCHGLPIENLVEKELKINSKKQIEELGVAKFCELCESKVMTYAEDWKEYVGRAGRWIDMANDYKTMDLDFMESVWWVFSEVWKKDLIYQGRKSVWICPRCATPLSSIEVNDPAESKEIDDPSIIVKFKSDKGALLAWTTTPWTIPGNVLLAVAPQEKYAIATTGKDDTQYILAEKRLKAVEEMAGVKFKVVKTVLGKELVGTKYEPVFDDMKSEEGKRNEVVAGEFVTMEDGTGIVHVAPAFGEDDFELGKKEKAGFVQHLNMEGVFTAPNEVKGQFIWDDNVEKTLLESMEKKGKLFFSGRYSHVYPFCWRCHTKLLNFATTAWFIKTIDIKDKLYENVEKTRWVPDYAKTGRLGDWMKNMQDWCISRNRYWGTPLPVWKCDKCDEVEVLGSVADLEKKSGKKVTNLHRNHVDNLAWKCSKCDGKMARIPEVLDCWFESGSMPYAQPHYPFENKEWFKQNFPADFVGEAVEQATKWFYTLLVLGTCLFDKAPYKNVVCTGIILAEDGKKMSKHLNNYPDPLKLFDEMGSDAVRFYIFNSPVVKAETLRFSEKGVREVVNNLIYMYWNTFKYFVTYAELHDWKPTFPMEKPLTKLERMLMENPKPNILDRWIVARTCDVIKEVNEAFGKYDLSEVVKPIQPFVFDLSTWYVRRSRDRFAKGDVAAFETMYWVLYQFTKAVAPCLPFTTEAVWQGLVVPWRPDFESVHLKLVSTIDNAKLSKMLSTQEEWKKVKYQTDITREFCSLGHKLRDQNELKVRQPLGRALLFDPGFEKDPALESAIREELNVKEIVYGLDLPKDGKWVEVEVKNADGSVKRKVVLDTEMTPELEAEGLKREIIRAIQDARKKAGLKVGEKAKVKLAVRNEDLSKAMEIRAEIESATGVLLQVTGGDKLDCEVL